MGQPDRCRLPRFRVARSCGISCVIRLTQSTIMVCQDMCSMVSVKQTYLMIIDIYQICCIMKYLNVVNKYIYILYVLCNETCKKNRWLLPRSPPLLSWITIKKHSLVMDNDSLMSFGAGCRQQTQECSIQGVAKPILGIGYSYRSTINRELLMSSPLPCS